MRRTACVGTVLMVVSASLASAAPAGARTSGKERFRGVVIATNPGGQRTVVSGWAAMRGVVDGTARIVEIPSRPSDPANVGRDDLVLPRGRLHIVSTSQPPQLALDPMTCVASLVIAQTTKIEGGTRRYRRASGTFTGTLRGWGVAPRKADGSCDPESPLLLEVADLRSRGTLRF